MATAAELTSIITQSSANATVLNTLLGLLHRVKRPDVRDKCLAEICSATVVTSAGNVGLVERLLTSVCNQAVQDTCRQAAAEAAAVRGDLDTARHLLLDRPSSVEDLANIFAQHGRADEAARLLGGVADSSARDQMHFRAASSAFDAGQWAASADLLGRIGDQETRTRCCDILVVQAMTKGNGDFAIVCWDLMSHRPDHLQRCADIANLASSAGHPQIAIDFAQRIRDQSLRAECLKAAALVAAQQGLWELSKSAISSISFADARNLAYQTIGMLAIENSNWEVIAELVSTVAFDAGIKRCIVTEAGRSAARSGCSTCADELVSCLPVDCRKLAEVELNAMTVSVDCCQGCSVAIADPLIVVTEFSAEPAGDSGCCQRMMVEEQELGAGLLVPVAKALIEDAEDAAGRNRIRSQASQALASRGLWYNAAHFAGQIEQQQHRNCCLLQVAECALTDEPANSDIVTMVMRKVSEDAVTDKALSAARQGNAELAKQLILQCLIHDAAKNAACKQAAELAAKNGHLEAAEILLRAIEDPVLKLSCCKELVKLAHVEDLHLILCIIPSVIADTKAVRDCFLLAVKRAADVEDISATVRIVATAEPDRELQKACYCQARKIMVEEANQTDAALRLLVALPDTGDLRRVCCSAEISAAMSANASDGVANFLTLIGGQFGDDWMAWAALMGRAIELVDDTSNCRRDHCQNAAITVSLQHKQWATAAHFADAMCDRELMWSSCVSQVRSTLQQKNGFVAGKFAASLREHDLRKRCCAEGVTCLLELQLWDAAIDFLESFRLDIDQQYVRLAEANFLLGHWEFADRFVQGIDDVSVRNRFCLTQFHLAAKADLSGQFAERFQEHVTYSVKSIAECSVRDDCYGTAATLAADANLWECTQSLVDCIENTEKKFNLHLTLLEPVIRGEQLAILLAGLECATNRDQRTRYLRGAIEKAEQLTKMQLIERLPFSPDDILEDFTLFNVMARLAMRRVESPALARLMPRMSQTELDRLLRKCIRAGHIALALTALKHLTEVDGQDEQDGGSSMLMLAADCGHQDFIEQLVRRRGASVRAADQRNRTALSRACLAGHANAVKALLLCEGSDLNHRDSDGLSCAQLAETRKHWVVMQELLGSRPEFRQEYDRATSESLVDALLKAGFTAARVARVHSMADFLTKLAQEATGSKVQLGGSYSDGWGVSLRQMNGTVAEDSDMDWIFLITCKPFHIQGVCRCEHVETEETLEVVAGHALMVPVTVGSQPAVKYRALGCVPAQDVCYAYSCCGPQTIICASEHLVRAARPDHLMEMRVILIDQEKDIVRRLMPVQGLLLLLLKFVFKRMVQGLKSYHAKTLVLFMSKEHTSDSENTWRPQNLIGLLRESLQMMLDFLDANELPEVCMPHYFMPGTSLYFKNAGFGGNAENTKETVRRKLHELMNNIWLVVDEVRQHLCPIKSELFHFHPFTLLPLALGIRPGEISNTCCPSVKVYQTVQWCLDALSAGTESRDCIIGRLAQLPNFCATAVACLKVMAQLKFCDLEAAMAILRALEGDHVLRGLDATTDVQSYFSSESSSDVAWRFVLPLDRDHRFTFLPEFTQSLFTVRRCQQSASSHLYVNFNCLKWSLQAELLGRSAGLTDSWQSELLGDRDPDLEELFTLAHYTDKVRHVTYCKQEADRLLGSPIAHDVEAGDRVKLDRIADRLHAVLSASCD